jgi:hypothetical protein
VRLVGVDAEAALLVGLVVLEVALEPFDMAVAFEGQHVGGDAVEEPAVMADDHGAAGESSSASSSARKRVDVEVVGRLVEQQQVGAGLQHLGQMHAVALAARELADLLLLVAALEVEGADNRRGVASSRLPSSMMSSAAGDFLPHRLLGIERVARLVDIAELHRLADLDRAGVGLFLAGDHAEQRGLAGAVGADDADDAAGRQLEIQILDQQPVAIALGQAFGFDHVSPSRSATGMTICAVPAALSPAILASSSS